MVLRGPAPGPPLALTAMAKAAALVRGRDYVLPEDVCLVFCDVVPHRLLLSPRAEADRSFDPASELLERVPAPGSPDAMAYRRIAYAGPAGRGSALSDRVPLLPVHLHPGAGAAAPPAVGAAEPAVGAGLHTASHLRRSHGGTGGGRGLSGAAAQPHPPAPAPASGPSPLEQPAHRAAGGCGGSPCAPHRRSAHSGAGHPPLRPADLPGGAGLDLRSAGPGSPCPSPPGGRRRC